MPDAQENLYEPKAWYEPGAGPRYVQLYRSINDAIRSGQLPANTQIPPERALAELADVSRVTVRKAVAKLVTEGLIEQRHGAGTFVCELSPTPKLQQSLSSLISFTENMRMRGHEPVSEILNRGLYSPTNDEVFALGLSPQARIARIKRLRSADDIPVALETSVLPEDILPNPSLVKESLYAVLRADGRAPVRAIQRVTACNLDESEADILRMKKGDAVLQIDRTAFLEHGRPIEFTRGLYRSDIYDFVSELRLEN